VNTVKWATKAEQAEGLRNAFPNGACPFLQHSETIPSFWFQSFQKAEQAPELNVFVAELKMQFGIPVSDENTCQYEDDRGQ